MFLPLESRRETRKGEIENCSTAYLLRRFTKGKKEEKKQIQNDQDVAYYRNRRLVVIIKLLCVKIPTTRRSTWNRDVLRYRRFTTISTAARENVPVKWSHVNHCHCYPIRSTHSRSPLFRNLRTILN